MRTNFTPPYKRLSTPEIPLIIRFSVRFLLVAVLVFGTVGKISAQTTLPMAARVNNAPSINGTVTGSVQEMQGQGLNLNSGAIITGDLYVPGVPTLQKNGIPSFQGIELGTGATTPTGYYITLNSGSQLRYLIERTNAVTFTAVPNPPTPVGTRSISVTPGNITAQIGTWSTVDNLTLNSNVGSVTVPAGSYGTFTANSGCSFVLGTAGATTPSTYSFDGLTLNSSSNLVINGPVIIQIKNSVTVNSSCVFGNAQNASWCTLNIANSGLTINSGGTLYGFVQAPTSSVNINGTLVGSVISSNYLTVNSGGLITGQTQSASQPPMVSIVNPVNDQVVQQYASTTIQATATAAQGTIAKVDFYENPGSGAVKIGTSTASPYSITWSVPPGTYVLTAIAADSSGLTTTSSPVTLYSNFAPSLQTSTSASVIAAGGSLTIYSKAADSDGTIALVQFYANGQLIGQSTTSPYSFTWTNVPAGNYGITIKATDNEGGVTTSSSINVVSAAPPAISITAPVSGTNLQSPASVTIQATASSSNTGGSIAKVDFYETSGTTTVKLGTSTTSPYSYVWNQPALGPYTLTAIATDNYGFTTTSAAVSIFVNKPPTLNLTTSATNGVVLASSGLVITSGAQDAVGTLTGVKFFANGQLIGSVTSSPFNYTWTNPTSGTYQITVTASDNHGGVTTSAPVTVTVAVPPTIAITAPAVGTNIQSPANVTIQANALTTNTNGTITKVDYYENNGTTTVKLGTSTSAPYSYTWNSPPVGPYTLTAIATDNYGFTTTSSAVGIFVNQLPTENVMTSASNGVVVSTGSLLITSNAQDSLGTISSVQFFANGQSIGTVTSAPFNFNWTNLTPGTDQITVQATDNHGGVTTSAPITVIVDQPPTVSISAPADGTPIQGPVNVTLQVTAASPNTNGSIAKVDFYADSGSGPTQIGEVTQAPYNFTWSQPAAGAYVVTAIATDNHGVTTTSSPVHLQVFGWNTLTEGSKFLSEQTYPITVPTNPQVLAVNFRNLNFDTTATGLNKDAFEIAMVDATGKSLVSTIATGRDSFFNTSEVSAPALAQGVASSTANGITTIYLNVSQIPAGTKGTLIARLVNNDADTATTVQVGQLISFPATMPTAQPYADPTELLPSVPLDFTNLVNLSTSFAAQFDRSSFNDQANIYYVRLGLQNIGTYLFKGRVAAVIDQISDPSVLVANPDGTNPQGLPYIDFTNTLTNGMLAVQSTSQERTIAFDNPNHVQFTYRLTFVGDPDHPPVFGATPPATASNGQTYSFTDQATDPDGDPLTYSLESGPTGLTINPNTGAISWSPGATTTPGNYQVAVLVSDNRGDSTQQTFAITLASPPPPRPPIFTSTPNVDALINTPYSYAAQAEDLDGNTLTYSVVTGPAGLTINPTSGAVSWTPTATQAGTIPVTLQVSDGLGDVATQTYNILVLQQAGASTASADSPPIFLQPTLLDYTSVPFAYNLELASDDAGLDGYLGAGNPVLGNVPFTIPLNTVNTWNSYVATGGGGGAAVLDIYPSATSVSEIDTLINTWWGAGGPNAYAYVEFFGSKGAYYIKPLVGNVDIRDYNQGYYTNYINNTTTTQVLVSPSGPYGTPNRLDKQQIQLPPEFQNQDLIHIRLSDYGGPGFQRTWIAGLSLLSPQQTGGAVVQAGSAFSYDFVAQDAANDTITYSATNLPAGASVNPSTGTFTWTPTSGQVGTYPVTFTATDTRGGTGQLNITFRVLSSIVDYAPIITSSPRTQIGFGNTYYYIVQTNNPTGNALTYSLTQAPAGMTISPGGYLSWTPSNTQLGANAVTLQVSDGVSAPVTQTFSINVLGINPNSSPTITSQPFASGVVGHVYSYNVQASDLDNDSLAYSLVNAPHGVSINALQGTLRWIPTLDQIGSQNITVQVRDSYGGLTTQTFAVNVNGTALPPQINSAPVTEGAVNDTYVYQVGAVDPDGDALTYSLNNAPVGMSIDPKLGLIQWIPSAGQVGSNPVEVQVSDAYGSVVQDYNIVVSTTSPTTSPTITDNPPYGVSPGGAYSFTLTATDNDGGALSYSLLNGPSGMTVDPNTGLVSWTASTANGFYPVSIAVNDSNGGTSILTYVLAVAQAQPPVINSNPPTQAYDNQQYSYAMIAHASNGGSLQYSISQGPTGLTINPTTGVVSWAVAANATGNYPVSIQVSDGRGGVATQNYTLAVTLDTTLPTVNLVQTINVINVGGQVGFQVQASDPVGISNIVLTEGTTPIALDRNNIAYVTFPTSGIYTFTATVTDNANNVATQQVSVRVIDPTSNDFPNVVVDQTNLQAANGIITAQTPLLATVQDAKLESWQVQIAPTNLIDQSNVAGDNPAYKTLASGTTAVSDAQVATIDPTTLANGSYFVRVIATNTDGNTNAQGVIITIESQNKLGRFFYSTTDLNIPLAGIPIQITRTYDSLNAGQSGDFGYGWNLSGIEANVQTSVPPPAQGVPSFFASQGSTFRVGSTVTITNPAGKRETFRFVPQLANLGIPGEPPGFGFFGATYTAAYQPEQGVYDTLTSDQTVLQVNGNGSVGGYLFNTAYNPTDFYLTTKDGHVYHYDTTNGLDDVHDRNGVSLTFTSSGITSSTGASIAYTRDPATNRITAVTDPNGNKIQYAYDGNGNLTSVTDQAGRKTQYTYLTSPAHYLNTLVDANGNPIAKTAFDASGRLSTFTDALGNITTFLYDPVNLIQTKIEPTDPTTGQQPTTVTFYDARGNVTQATNEIGNNSTTTYDANNNPLVVTVPNGDQTTYTYDANGNQLTKKDSLGNITTNTFDGNNNLTSVMDPLGHLTTYSYDGDGNLTTVVDALGNTTQLSDDALGRPIALTDALGHTTQFAYTDNPTTGIAGSQPTAVTRVDGSTLQFTYNSFGSVTSATDENGNTSQLQNDSGGILQKRIEADGATTSYGYDGNGNLTSVTDALGKVTGMKYDAAFHLTERDGPNGEVTKFTYDQLGRLSSKIDPLNRTTTRHYRADGVLASITQPDSTVITFDNDVNGRRTGVTDPDGNHTMFSYNSNSQVLSETDPLGKITQYSYDGAGNLSNVMDRLGRVRQFTYNANNQLTQETWLASLTATSPIKTISTSYDALGNVLGTGDDTGTLGMQYDGRNRLQTLTTNYTGQPSFVLNYGYDAGSRVTSVTDGDGVSVGTSYDQRNNVSQITWQGTGIAARANFTRDPLGDLTNIKRYADLAGNNLIGQSTFSFARNLPNIGYQAATFNAGENESLQDSTQPLSRLSQITHQDGNGNTLLSEGYANDQAGQLTVKTVGSDTSSYGYDQTGQLLSETHSVNTSANESYTYNAGGSRTKTGTQTTANTIATDNRITVDSANTYTYDDEGNLIAKTTTATGQTWIYSYDLRNRMTSAVQTNSGGNMLSHTSYVYDVLDRRISKTINGQTAAFFYEGNNLWKSINASANVTHYLTDGAVDHWLARANSSAVNWYLTDRLGSVTGITDSNGNLLNSTTYDSYGHILSQSNPAVADQLAFTGREYDAETGLYYFRARYYNPALGRFLSEDPIKFDAGDFNINRYIRNSPTNGWDPLGQTAEEDAILRDTVAKQSTAVLEVALSAGNAISEFRTVFTVAQEGGSVLRFVVIRANVQALGDTLDVSGFSIREVDEARLGASTISSIVSGIEDAARLLGFRRIAFQAFRFGGANAGRIIQFVYDL